MPARTLPSHRGGEARAGSASCQRSTGIRHRPGLSPRGGVEKPRPTATPVTSRRAAPLHGALAHTPSVITEGADEAPDQPWNGKVGRRRLLAVRTSPVRTATLRGYGTEQQPRQRPRSPQGGAVALGICPAKISWTGRRAAVGVSPPPSLVDEAISSGTLEPALGFPLSDFRRVGTASPFYGLGVLSRWIPGLSITGGYIHSSVFDSSLTVS